MVEFLILIILIFLALNLNLKIIKNLKSIERKIFISSPNEYLVSVTIVMIFFFFFFLCFRFLRLIINNNNYINLNNYKWLFDYCSITNILLILILMYILFKIKKVMIITIKLNFVKVLLYNYDKINKIFIFLKSIGKYKIKRRKIIFIEFPRIICYLYLFLQLILSNGIIYIGFLSWYAMYFFLINSILFFCDFKSNFDAGVCIFYKGVDFNENGLFKITEYQKYIILKKSDYFFIDDIDILNFPKIKDKKNVLHFNYSDYNL